MAAQLTATKGLSLRGLILCSMLANFSLPTPDSPVKSTVAVVRATRLSWWQSSWDLLLVGAAILGGAAWLDALTWQVGLFVIISVNANQVHKWSHQTRAEVGPIVAFLQRYWILQSPRQHALHHTDPKNTHYCPLTNLVNPTLEALRFWDRLEWVLEKLTGAKHRSDTSNRGEGPAPEWLSEFRRPGSPR